jgi:predicted helicase
MPHAQSRTAAQPVDEQHIIDELAAFHAAYRMWWGTGLELIASNTGEEGLKRFIEQAIQRAKVPTERASQFIQLLQQIQPATSTQERATAVLPDALQTYERFVVALSAQKRLAYGQFYTPNALIQLCYKGVYHCLQQLRNQSVPANELVVIDLACGTGGFLIEGLMNAQQFLSDYRPTFIGIEAQATPAVLAQWHTTIAGQLSGQATPTILHLNPLTIDSTQQQELMDLVQGKTLIIVGNPPFKGISHNKSDWMRSLLEDYKFIDGQHFGERKHWLNDDYVQCLRWAQWLSGHARQAIVCLVTNHSFADNPTFRGLRWQLAQHYDHIWCLDLQGNGRKRQQADPAGDQNLFGIESGIATTWMVRGAPDKQLHGCSWTGSKSDKLGRCAQTAFDAIDWQPITPQAPMYLWLTPTTQHHLTENEQLIQSSSLTNSPSWLADDGQAWPIRKLFPMTSAGIITARDHFVIAHTREELETRLMAFTRADSSDAEVGEALRLHDTTTFSLSKARHILREQAAIWQDFIHPIAFRPMDTRLICYHPALVERRLFSTMQHLLPQGQNRALVFQRGCSSSRWMNLPQVSSSIIEHGLAYPANRAISFIAPLYRMQEGTREVNIAPEFMAQWEARFQHAATPEDILAYLLTLLSASWYRAYFEQQLAYDFPLIHWVSSAELALELVAYGHQLMDNYCAGMPVDGVAGDMDDEQQDVVLQQVAYRDGSLWLNRQRVDTVIRPVDWAMEIGGYPVLRKWLKGQQGRPYNERLLAGLHNRVERLQGYQSILEGIDALCNEQR